VSGWPSSSVIEMCLTGSGDRLECIIMVLVTEGRSRRDSQSNGYQTGFHSVVSVIFRRDAVVVKPRHLIPSNTPLPMVSVIPTGLQRKPLLASSYSEGDKGTHHLFPSAFSSEIL
jgi:hypothetical protein